MTAQPGDEPERAMRLDARRNLEAILEAARAVLADRPDASMQEIAEAAGVHRATVHRHFASREDLVRAVGLRAVEEGRAAAREAHLEEGPAPEALRRLTVALVHISDRYRLARFSPVLDPSTARAREDLRQAAMGVLARGQREGTIRRDLPPEVLVVGWGGLLIGVQAAMIRGTMSRDVAADFVVRILLGPDA